MDGWEAWQRQTADGAVESEQRVALAAPVVEFSVQGAAQLGHAYWSEVRRLTWNLVRPREGADTLELRLLGSGPALLCFGGPTVEATETLASCSYSIQGGLLARRPAGEISFAQLGGPAPLVRSTVRGFVPRLPLHNQLQSRLHLAISRRYFARLISEARR